MAFRFAEVVPNGLIVLLSLRIPHSAIVFCRSMLAKLVAAVVVLEQTGEDPPADSDTVRVAAVYTPASLVRRMHRHSLPLV